MCSWAYEWNDVDMSRFEALGPKSAKNMLAGGASALVVVIALALMVLQAQAVFINISGVSLSVYALVLVSGLLAIGAAVMVLREVLGDQTQGSRREISGALATLSPLLALSVYATIRLALEWRLEGAQNLLALYVLTVGPLVFWLSRSWPAPEQLLRAMSWTIGPTAILYIYFRLSDLPGFADRQFAMVALVGLAVSVSLTPRNFAERLIPYIVFLSITVSGSRTASAVALVLLSTLPLRQAGSVIEKFLRALGYLIAGFGVGVVSFVLLGFATERVQESGVAETAAEVILNSNGRLGAWAEFLGLMTSPLAWVFGLGTGAAMEFGTANLAFFSHPHNEYIRYLVDLGVLGLMLLAAGCASVLVALLRNRQFSADAPRAATLVVIALAGMSLTDGPLYSSFVIIPSALVIGSGLRSTRGPAKTRPQVHPQ